MTTISNEALDKNTSVAACVAQAVQKYFAELKGTDPVYLYQFVI